MLARTVLVGGGRPLVIEDVLGFSSEGKVPWGRRQAAGLALARVPVHLWLRRLCNVKCPAAPLGPAVGGGTRLWSVRWPSQGSFG